MLLPSVPSLSSYLFLLSLPTCSLPLFPPFPFSFLLFFRPSFPIHFFLPSSSVRSCNTSFHSFASFFSPFLWIGLGLVVVVVVVVVVAVVRPLFLYNIWPCLKLFVCLFVCLFICLFVCCFGPTCSALPTSATIEMGWGQLRRQLREFTLNTQVGDRKHFVVGFY